MRSVRYDTPDGGHVELQDHGTVVLLRARGALAAGWVAEHIQAEPWQHIMGGVAVEPSYVLPVMRGMHDDGLVTLPPEALA